MSITAFPVLARILHDRGLQRTPAGTIALAAAAANDATAWCILALVTCVARASGYADVAWRIALAVGFVFVLLVPVRTYLERRATDAPLTRPRLARVLVGAVACAFVTEQLGLHALFGAFVAGLAVPRSGGLARAVDARLGDAVSVVLMPLFFVLSGLRTDVSLLAAPAAWLPAVLVTVIAVAGKFGGAALSARFAGSPWREAFAVGSLTNARGLVELVVLNVGLDLGVISPSLFVMMVLMTLVTTAMTAPLLDRFVPRTAAG